MERSLVILVVIAVVVGIIALAIHAHKLEQMRLAALREFAASMGWTFDTRRNPSHDDRFPQFAAFRRGDNRYAFNTLSGSTTIDGRTYQARMGDYHYQITRSNGKSTTTTHYTFSYLILTTPFSTIPETRIRREGFLDKVAGALGFDDIDFESAEFSRKFHVSGRDKRFAYDLVTPQMMEYLMSAMPGEICLANGCFLITDGTSRWEPTNYPVMLSWATQFIELWPRHVVQSLDDASSARRTL